MVADKGMEAYASDAAVPRLRQLSGSGTDAITLLALYTC